MSPDPFSTPISRHVWDAKYRYRDADAVHDHTVEDTWWRVARALAAAEPRDRAQWEERFYQALSDFRFLPGGRILAGAGTGRRVTLFNCFVMGRIDDSMDGIFDALKEGALTMQQGGGVGYDFSTLRPAGTYARSVGGIASGPVSFMRIWDAMCSTLLSTGARRGAMMATLRCDHPDIERFIEVKKDPHELRHFNLSVLVTDAFMAAVRADSEWPLVFPASRLGEESAGARLLSRLWPGEVGEVPCRVLKVLRARELWSCMMRATYDYAEPGILFIDRINALNNLHYKEAIAATNPCGEIPLPPYGACNLGSVNLTRFVREPFTERATLDFAGIEQTAAVAVRMMDNVIDVSRFPLEAQAHEARGSRRIGLGFTGLADAFITLGVSYGQERSYTLAAQVMRRLCHTAYRTSLALAEEKGAFPFLDKGRHLETPFVQALPQDIREGIAATGIRNSHLTAIAPTGTISLLANNVSSGIEPVFEFAYTRRILEADGSYSEHPLKDYARELWDEFKGNEPPGPAFTAASRLAPEVHLRMQAAVQPWVDNAISKTINIPVHYAFEDFKSVYEQAYDLGLKGCTTFRPNPVTGAILSTEAAAEAGSHCCSIEREAD